MHFSTVTHEHTLITAHTDLWVSSGAAVTDNKPLQPSTALLFLVLLHRVEQTQDVQEEVDNVQVEVDGGQDVLLGGELLHQQVSVVDNEGAEDQSAGSSKDQLRAIAVEKELKREQSQHGTGEA